MESEAQLLKNYLQAQEQKRVKASGGLTMDFGRGPEDVSQYLNMGHPATQTLKMMSDPYVLFADGDAQRKRWPLKDIPQYVWRKRTDRYTVQLVNQGKLTPVFKDEIDLDSDHAVFDEVKVPVAEKGFKSIVANWGLCLYRVSPQKAAEWFQAPVNSYKGDLARMVYSETDVLKQAGYQAPRQFNGLNMEISDTRDETFLGNQ